MWKQALVMIVFVLIVGSEAGARPSRDDYAIWSLLLRGESNVVLVDTTSPIALGLKTRKYRQLAAEYTRVNRNPISIERELSLKNEYQLISLAELDPLLEEGRELDRKARKDRFFVFPRFTFDPFRRRFPRANGYFSVSRVAYDRRRRFAVACYSFNRLAAETVECAGLKRAKGGWVIGEMSWTDWIV